MIRLGRNLTKLVSCSSNDDEKKKRLLEEDEDLVNCVRRFDSEESCHKNKEVVELSSTKTYRRKTSYLDLQTQ